MGQIKSWEVSDELWAVIEPLIPPPRRDPSKSYSRAPGAGRKPMDPRAVFAAIVFVLRTGMQWKALPKSMGSSSSVHAYFMRWAAAGFFTRMWAAGLAEYDGMHGIAWEWQSVDGSQGKAPLALECVGPNPTDRGKKWTQTKLACRRQWRPFVDHRQRSQHP